MRKRHSFYVRLDTVAELRGAAAWFAQHQTGPPSMSAIVETGIRRELDRLAKRHHDGKPFPPAGPLVVGPPSKRSGRSFKPRSR